MTDGPHEPRWLPLLLSAALACACNTGYAQDDADQGLDEDAERPEGRCVNCVTLSDKVNSSESATISYLNPSGAPTTYAVDAALALATHDGFFGRDALLRRARLGAEYSRNTQVTSAIDFRSLVAIVYAKNSRDRLPGLELVEPSLAISRSEDNVAKRDALRARLEAKLDSPWLMSGNFKYLPRADKRRLRLWTEPTVGGYYDKTVASDSPNANSYGVSGRMTLFAVPLPDRAVGKHLQLFAKYQYIRELGRTDAESMRGYAYREIGVRWNLDPDDTSGLLPSIGLARVSGADPFQGINAEPYVQVMLEVRGKWPSK